jgi:HAD superfamily hydrolase (TIGR01509 family)
VAETFSFLVDPDLPGVIANPDLFSAVVFDLDGLLINTEDLYQEVGAELLRRRGRTFSADLLDQMMGRPGSVSLAIMIEQHGLDDTVEALYAESEQIFGPILDARLAPMPGAPQLLAALEEIGIAKAIATSSRRSLVDNVLGRLGWQGRFSFELTAEDVHRGKPDPEIYLTAAQRFGVLPERMVVFEDSHHGCAAAVRAGAYAVAVPSGHSRRHEFKGAALILASLCEGEVYELFGLRRGD